MGRTLGEKNGSSLQLLKHLSEPDWYANPYILDFIRSKFDKSYQLQFLEMHSVFYCPDDEPANIRPAYIESICAQVGVPKPATDTDQDFLDILSKNKINPSAWESKIYNCTRIECTMMFKGVAFLTPQLILDRRHYNFVHCFLGKGFPKIHH